MRNTGLKLLLGALCLMLTSYPAPGEEDPAGLAKKILDHPSYQKKLVTSDGPYKSIGSETTIRSTGLGFGRVLLYLLMTLAVALAVIWIVNHVHNRWTPSKKTTAEDPGETQARSKDPSLDEIEALARAKRFEEAVHKLLFLAVKRLASIQNKTLAQEMTSRELMRILPRNREEKGRFRLLVNAVELSLFGGRETDASQYRACLENYRGLNL